MGHPHRPLHAPVTDSGSDSLRCPFLFYAGEEPLVVINGSGDISGTGDSHLPHVGGVIKHLLRNFGPSS